MKKAEIIAGIAAVVCMMGTAAAGFCAERKGCPAREELTDLLGTASRAMQEARYTAATQTLRPVAKLHCDPRASLLLAAAEEAGGQAQAAEQTLEQAHTRWPLNTSIAASLARTNLNAGEAKKALAALEHFKLSRGMPEQEMEMAALVYMANHQLVPAQTAAETAYKAYPSLHTLLLFANTLQLEGRYPDVNRLLNGQRETYGDAPAFLITLAESEYDAGLYQEAKNDIGRAVALDSGSYQAHYILANVLIRLGEQDRAIAEYKTALQLAPGQPRTAYQLALALRDKQDVAGEEWALGQALHADADYAPAQCELGRILLEENRVQEAVPHLRRAIAMNARSEEAYYLLVRAYAKLGEKDQSREVAKQLETVRKANRPNQSGQAVAVSPR